MKDRFGYGTEDTENMSKIFKANTSAWLRLTENPGALDKRRWDWKSATENFMKNPDYVKFVEAQDLNEKYNIVKNNLHPALKGMDKNEILSTISGRFEIYG